MPGSTPTRPPAPPVFEQTVRYPARFRMISRSSSGAAPLARLRPAAASVSRVSSMASAWTARRKAGSASRRSSFGLSQDRLTLPGKNSTRPGTIRPWVRIDDPSLTGRALPIRSTSQGRSTAPQQVRLLVKLQFIPPWILRIIYLLAFLLGTWVGLRWWRLWRCRAFFVGAVNSVNFREGTPQHVEISFRGPDFGRMAL